MKLLSVISIVFLLSGCSAQTEEGQGNFSQGSADKSIKAFVLTEHKGEKKDWELEAENGQLLKTQEGEIIEVSNYKMSFFEEEASVSRLEGIEGVYDRETQVFHAPSKVEIISEERRIITSDVRWHPEEEIFTTDREVEIHTPHGLVRGVGMTASKDLNRIDIREKISGELQNVDTD